MESCTTINNAYVSVEINDSGLETMREGLRSMFGESGIGCEIASSAAHVSIAYGEGEVAVEALDRVASEIAALPFTVRASGFELLKGVATEFDYLVVTLDHEQCFGAAVEAVQGCMKTKSFAGGFRSHVSLLKFAHGSFSRSWAERVIAEMNASHSAARALGWRVSLKGAQISVFTSDRQCHLSKTFANSFSSVAA